ncbi:protein of unknown function [Reichenbachiella faecimaris]|uniref:DUF4249 domain-containing protein n=1 Tax=Reichenbachiella faecimaris TaxID=692418 RepID=A0A1W2GEE0_REIFA|nr:DUF4249 domain-containing protein [Reichenbachiella faecimaris]SMD34884.1 protein of unknown function [Reichenbachiella faecimaris]
MKSNFKYLILSAFGILSACDDQIYPELDDAPEVLVVDAWIDDLMQDQVVTLSMTQPYFESSETKPVTGAEVYITDNDGNRFDFIDEGVGQYVWSPMTDGFGIIGNTYELTVVSRGDTFKATSMKNRVPKVDSITFEYNEDKIFGTVETYYSAELWVTDLIGEGDIYWIKTFKNEEFLNKPSEISLAWDAGFNKSAPFDGDPFIPPIRSSINPEDYDDNDEFISPYADGDSVYVELHAITESARNFLSEVQIQTNREGGFGALFATPLSNVPTNIKNETSDRLVVGFFSVSSVETNGNKLDVSQVPKEN